MSTQNDWEKELLQALILDQPPVEVMFIKGVENLVRTCTWSQFVTVVDKFRADARKEERMKAEVETGLKNFKVTMEEISKARKEVGNGIEKMYLSVADEEPRYDTVEEIQAYNQAIYEILATLKEEK